MTIDFKRLSQDPKNHKENTTMGNRLSPNLPENRIVLDPDVYLLRIDDISEKSGTVREDDGTERASIYYRWIFTIVDPRLENQALHSLRGNTGQATGLKSKTYAWVSAALGKPWDSPIDWPDDLIGRTVKGVIDIKVYRNEYGQDVQYNTIEKLLPVKVVGLPATAPGRYPAPPTQVAPASEPVSVITDPSVISAASVNFAEAPSNPTINKAALIHRIGTAVTALEWDRDAAKTNRYEVVPKQVPIKELTVEELTKVAEAFEDALRRKQSIPPTPTTDEEDPNDIPF